MCDNVAEASNLYYPVFDRIDTNAKTTLHVIQPHMSTHPTPPTRVSAHPTARRPLNVQPWQQHRLASSSSSFTSPPPHLLRLPPLPRVRVEQPDHKVREHSPSLLLVSYVARVGAARTPAVRSRQRVRLHDVRNVAVLEILHRLGHSRAGISGVLLRRLQHMPFWRRLITKNNKAKRFGGREMQKQPWKNATRTDGA